jgi:hypothetical protein
MRTLRAVLTVGSMLDEDLHTLREELRTRDEIWRTQLRTVRRAAP